MAQRLARAQESGRCLLSVKCRVTVLLVACGAYCADKMYLSGYLPNHQGPNAQ